jgi:molybdenum cofactor cytidylyltransferase
MILAAGSSRRLGRPKQTLPLQGTTVLGLTIQRLAPVFDHVVVVLGAESQTILSQVDLSRVDVHINPHFQEGQSTSIIAGIQAIEAHHDIQAAMILLGDQPLLCLEVLQDLITTWRKTQSATVVPRYGTQRGNPVLFSRVAWSHLYTLTGDHGARLLLAKNEPAPLIEVEFPLDWLPQDIDTEEDYQKMLRP